MSGSELIRYDAMCQAIAAAYAVDEVKVHPRQSASHRGLRAAGPQEAESKVCEIRLRAERRCGQLLRDMEKNKSGGDQRSDHRFHAETGGPPKAKDDNRCLRPS